MPDSPSIVPQAGTMRTATPTREGGSRTIQIQQQPALRPSAPQGVLRLRAGPTERRRIQWAEDVVDNEGMGKKSSKVCCIYHKPRAADESSDEDSSGDSSSESDSDSEPDNSTARPSGWKGGQRGRHPHEHGDGDCEHEHDDGEGSGKPQKHSRPRRKPSPNAYEKMPKNKR